MRMFVTINTVDAIVQYYMEKLAPIYEQDEVKRIIECVFEHLLNWSPSKLWLNRQERLSESDLLNFHFALKRLVKGEPIQYVIGYAYFYGLKLTVDSSVLIPRTETEELVDWIVKETEPTARIIDIGTGSGCIPIALKANLYANEVVGVDISFEALEMAKKNAVSNGVEVTFIQVDVFDSDFQSYFDNKWDVIVSNPPYIPLSEKKEMHTNVVSYEPHLALFVKENDALIFYNRIADLAIDMLAPNGKLYFEISNQKGEDVVRLLHEKGFANVELRKDLHGNDRMVAANR
jgi:release factor glutamine methyltransferase